MHRVAQWSSPSPRLLHESAETNLRACAGRGEHLLLTQSGLAPVSVGVETSLEWKAESSPVTAQVTSPASVGSF